MLSKYEDILKQPQNICKKKTTTLLFKNVFSDLFSLILPPRGFRLLSSSYPVEEWPAQMVGNISNTFWHVISTQQLLLNE